MPNFNGILTVELQAFSLLGVAIAFGLSLVQVRMGLRVGTDRAVHDFLIRQIRNNNGRLFTRIPSLLNNPGCGALPLYLHWLFSKLPARFVPLVEAWLNPLINLIHVLLVAAIAMLILKSAGFEGQLAFPMAAIYALTPQFFHALSARNFGLSSRGIGLMLLTAFYAGFVWVAASMGPSWLGWVAMILSAYLIFAFNTFAMQALFILSAILSLVSIRFAHWGGIASGLVVFVAIHPRYSLAYLGHTLRFIRAYAHELAPIYILGRRASIWRDLVWDIWVRLVRSPENGFRYAYENSVLISILLNPLSVASAAFRFSEYYGRWHAVDIACDLAIAGVLAMLLTSLRLTRFLGEPERYVEAVTPWCVIAGGLYAALTFGLSTFWILICVFAALNICQLCISSMLQRHTASSPINIDAAEDAIQLKGHKKVRICSNNEHLTKLFLKNEWQFSYCIAVGEDYCGMAISEAFSRFPHLTKKAVEKIAIDYRINTVVLDRSQFDTLFEERPSDLHSINLVYASPGLTVLSLNWAGE
ncbi:hypothetical protein [Altererythrobacter sp. Root672]|uniref:hypothetical protein n=1 Tax=Altererythrobacter sp. Root672 TaxID=1736584 RepID=UPI0006F4736E|nr:hypothetical protein [Altererythrobacter sp. Root672]KRA83194.1 hypothetical protein ASD76_03750 [Altererythrobacter sp. Root672]